MFIVVYRPHSKLRVETQHFGPYPTYEAAELKLTELPALGVFSPADESEIQGCKYIEELLR